MGAATQVEPPTFVLVGGFLGSGKTTLIMRAARLLREQGRRVVVITNDQDSGLVDTKYAQAHEFGTHEVSGGCFCCRFSDLVEAAEQFREYQPDVIFAEPVGSCLDLSATVLQPLKLLHRDRYRLAPYSVLIDPARADAVYQGEADRDVGFLFRNQIGEADILCTSKADLYPVSPTLPVPVDFRISALNGQGVAEWLAEVLRGKRVTGARVLDIDYDRYAEAEAAMGWLNLHAEVEPREPLSPAAVVGPLLERLDGALTSSNISIAHLKIFDQAESGYLKAGICANGVEPVPEGDLAASPAERHELVINLRAIGDPRQLRDVVQETLMAMHASVAVGHVAAFRPARPHPEHRLPRPV